MSTASGSFSLVLMTRKRVLYADNSNEKRSLSHYFLLMFHQNKHPTMLDCEIADGAAAMVVLEKLAVFAVHCLSARGDDRPTMKEVAERLQVLRRHQMHAPSDGKNVCYFDSNYGGSPSVVLPLDEMTNGSLETSAPVLAV